MFRSALLLTLLGLLAAPALAQDSPDEAKKLSARPAELLPPTPAGRWIEENLAESGAPLDGDSLSAPELARRVARLYANQSEMLVAEVEGDIDRYEDLLDATMRDLRQLVQRPGVMEQPRFRELYRSVLTEHERYRGPDTELALQQGDVFAIRAAMFAALDEVDEPLLEDVTLPTSVVATFPMEINRAVESHIRFLLRKTGHLRAVRSRAATYFPMIEQVLAEEGVPDELKYLAVIESAHATPEIADDYDEWLSGNTWVFESQEFRTGVFKWSAEEFATYPATENITLNVPNHYLPGDTAEFRFTYSVRAADDLDDAVRQARALQTAISSVALE